MENAVMSYRLDQYLTLAGEGSRSQVKQFLKKGLVQVDGITEKQAKRKVLGNEQITLNGKPVYYEEHCYLMLHKPAGVVTATEDKKEKTVMDLITLQQKKDLFPVGRLDKDTEGLLLVTNDGELAHRLLSPKKHVDKVYLAYIEGTLPKDAAEQMKNGVILEDGVKTRPAELICLSREEGEQRLGRAPETAFAEAAPVTLTIHEGKFHQVKRMFEALGCRVVFLKRLSMGTLCLDPALLLGEYRPLTQKELAGLKGEISEI